MSASYEISAHHDRRRDAISFMRMWCALDDRTADRAPWIRPAQALPRRTRRVVLLPRRENTSSKSAISGQCDRRLDAARFARRHVPSASEIDQHLVKARCRLRLNSSLTGERLTGLPCEHVGLCRLLGGHRRERRAGEARVALHNLHGDEFYRGERMRRCRRSASSRWRCLPIICRRGTGRPLACGRDYQDRNRDRDVS